jgi:fibronectin-binding autotransporter adhesin
MKKIFGAIFFASAAAFGSTSTWQAASNGSMSNAANWSPTGQPSGGSDLNFPSTNVSVFTVINDISNLYSVNSLTINSTSNPYMFQGDSFTMSGNTISSTGANTITLGLVLGSTMNIVSSTSPLTINGAVSSPAATVLTLTQGALTLSGSNAFSSGSTIVIAGSASPGATLTLPTVIAPLSGVTTITDNGALVLTEAGNENWPATTAIGGSGILQMNGSGIVNFASANTYTGGTQILQGTLAIAAQNNLSTGTVTLGGGTLQFNSPIVGFDLPIVLSSNSTISTANNNVTIGSAGEGTISESSSGVGSLNVVAGTATLTLGGANTYSGGTKIVSGTLSITNSSNIGTGLLVMGSTVTLSVTSNASITNGIFLLGQSTINGNSHSVTISNQIKGSGPLTLTPGTAGTIYLSSSKGPNSYINGTTVTNGTVSGDTSSIQGPFTLDPGTTLIFDQSFNGTYAGALSSSGTVSIDGSGIVTLSGNSGTTYTGLVNVSGGTLNVTGNIQGATVTVVSGGTLVGTGTVGQATISGGTLGPNGVNTLTFDGNLTMASSPNTIVNIGPGGVSDLFSVEGNAIITGSLTVEPESGFYGFGSTYTILEATGTRTGTYTTVAAPANFTVTPDYAIANEVLLVVDIIQPFFNYTAANYNEQSVANNINALAASGALGSNEGLVAAINALVGESDDVINDALNQLHPAMYSALGEMQTEVGSQIATLFHRRPGPVCCDNTYRAWVMPFGNWLEEGSKGIQLGFSSNTMGIATGFDWEVFDNFVLGFGGVWDHSNLDWNHHRGFAHANTYYGAAYLDYTYKCFYLGATFLGGVDQYNTARHIEFTTIDQTAKANHDAVDLVGQVCTGLFFGPSACCFWPYFNVEYLYLGQNSFSENGADGLDLDVQSINEQTVRTELGFGLKVQDTNYRQTMCISPHVALGWIVEHPVVRNKIITNFQGESIPFNVIGWDYTWELFNFILGLDFSYKCFTVGGQYDGEFSSDGKFWAQRGNVKLSYKW